MPIDNQTLVTLIKNAVQSSITPDYFGWIIGIVGLVVGSLGVILAFYFHAYNQHLEKEREQEKKDREENSASLLSLAILPLVMDLEQTVVYETEMREKGLIPITIDSSKETQIDIFRNPEYQKLHKECEYYAEKSKKNIENIEKILGFVRNDVDHKLTYKLTLFLQKLKEWEWSSSTYTYSLITMTMMHPTASILSSELNGINEELEKMAK